MNKNSEQMSDISVENLGELDKRYKSTVMIVFAQIFLTLILMVIIWFVPPVSANVVSSNTLTTLWIAVLFVALGTFLLRRILMRWGRLKDITLLKGIPGIIRTLQFNAVFLGSLAEVVSILGFIIAILTNNGFEMLRAGIIALVAFFINFPRKNVWKKVVFNLEKI